MSMKNLFDSTVANQVKTRLEKLDPQTERRWGKMTAAQMLAHCSVSDVSERRSATEEFADGEEPDCGRRTRFGKRTGAVIRID
jgi:hypothetical protein